MGGLANIIMRIGESGQETKEQALDYLFNWFTLPFDADMAELSSAPTDLIDYLQRTRNSGPPLQRQYAREAVSVLDANWRNHLGAQLDGMYFGIPFFTLKTPTIGLDLRFENVSGLMDVKNGMRKYLLWAGSAARSVDIRPYVLITVTDRPKIISYQFSSQPVRLGKLTAEQVIMKTNHNKKLTEDEVERIKADEEELIPGVESKDMGRYRQMMQFAFEISEYL